ncbi:MAG: cytochrome c3 family protein [Deferrisomatales bacterium]
MKRHGCLLLGALLLTVGPAWAADFRHDQHLAYVDDTPCSTCHKPDAKSIVPASAVCLDCHEQEFVKEARVPGPATHGPVWALNPGPAARGKTYDCSACHEQKHCLDCHKAGFADEMGSFGNQMVNVHRSDFHVTHPIASRTDPQRCSSCHEPKFCTDCHDRFTRADLSIQSHRRGFTDGTLGGAHASFTEQQCQGCHVSGSVIPSHTGWSTAHAREARKNLATCQACHPQGDTCLKCHSAVSGLRVNPHPKDWDDVKGRLKRASDGKTCRKCH